MLIQKYIKKQEPIEVVYFDGTEESAKEIVKWIGDDTIYVERNGIIIINTKEHYSDERIIPGDYIKKESYKYETEDRSYCSVINIDDYKLVEE